MEGPASSPCWRDWKIDFDAEKGNYLGGIIIGVEPARDFRARGAVRLRVDD
jgi:hypothetical protein